MCILLVFVAGGLSFSFSHNRPTYASDSVTYIEGARSLAAGQGYYRGAKPITAWPPGYSMLLSAPVAVGLDAVIVFKVVNILMALVAVVFWYFLFSQFVPRWAGCGLAVILGTYFPWVYYTHAILADIPFSAAVAAFLFCGCVYANRREYAWLGGAACAGALAVLLRSAGVALLPPLLWLAFFTPARESVPGWGMRGRLLRSGGAVMPAIGVLLVWFLRNVRHTGRVLGYRVDVTPEYALSLEQIGITDPSLFDRVWVNLRGYLHIFVLPDQTAIARNVPWFIVVGCVLAWGVILLGGALLLRSRHGRFVCLVFVVYMAMLFLNTWYDIRYLLPVLGICLVSLYIGIAWIASRLSVWLRWRPLGPFLQVAFVMLLIGGNLAVALVSPPARNLRARHYRSALQRMYEACRFIRDDAGKGHVLVAGSAGFVPVWTGRSAVSVLSYVQDDGCRLEGIPDAVGYVLFTEDDFMPYRENYLEPWFKTVEPHFTLVYADRETKVWRRKPL